MLLFHMKIQQIYDASFIVEVSEDNLRMKLNISVMHGIILVVSMNKVAMDVIGTYVRFSKLKMSGCQNVF